MTRRTALYRFLAIVGLIASLVYANSRGMFSPKVGPAVQATEEAAVAEGSPESVLAGEPTAQTAEVYATPMTANTLSQFLGNTTTVSQLIAALDKAYELNPKMGGTWSEEDATKGFTVPANSVFWTDLFENVNKLPSGVQVGRVTGGWGVYTTTVAFKIPLPNGGGRYAVLEAGKANEVKSLMAAEATASACIPEAELNKITNATDPVAAFNTYFEKFGYAFGKSVAVGETVKSGGIFLGTFTENAVPTTVTSLAGGYIWKVNADTKSPNGGRWIAFCK